MKKAEIISELASTTGISKTDVTTVYEAIFDLIKSEVAKGNDFAVSGFGTFKKSERAARTGRNPQTGETIQIAASNSASFKIAKAFKEELNK